ncbi:hypothetical protein JE959_001761 [Aeromonas veronii]|nr:hypothetical protein [Aeromonas veronii]
MNLKELLSYQELMPMDGKEYAVFGIMIDPAMWLAIKASIAFVALILLLLSAICGPYYTVHFYDDLRKGANKGKERARAAAASRRRIRF